MKRWLTKHFDVDVAIYYGVAAWIVWDTWIDYRNGEGTEAFGLFTALVVIIAAESGRIRKTIREEARRGEPAP